MLASVVKTVYFLAGALPQAVNFLVEFLQFLEVGLVFTLQISV